MNLLKRALLLGCVSTVAACANGGDVRSLSEAEMKIMKDTHARLEANQKLVNGSLNDLEDNLADALADQHSLSLSISKAKLLESMKSPWVRPHPELAATQKEVAFYHLYALAEAEQAAFDARLREREQAIAEVKKAYSTLIALMTGLIESQKLILSHLNQPSSARVSLFVNNVLAEVKAFRKTLETSESPRLRELAKEVADAEAKVEKARDRINEVLETTGKLRGG